jgi:CBS domain containing-hemolysin-like protein
LHDVGAEARLAEVDLSASPFTLSRNGWIGIVLPRFNCCRIALISALQRNSRHEQVLLCQGAVDETIGIILKKDLLDQALDGVPVDPMAQIREPLVVPETMPIVRVLEEFKKRPVRLALVVDEYGSLEGIVTQTDLLEAIAGDLPEAMDEQPDVIDREDRSLLMEGMMPAHDAADRLGISLGDERGDFHTLAGFVLHRLARIPAPGDKFVYQGWRFEVVDMDGQRIKQLLVSRISG